MSRCIATAAALLLAAAAARAAQEPGRPRPAAAELHIGLCERRAGHAREAMLALARAIATDARDGWEWSWARRRLADVAAADKSPR